MDAFGHLLHVGNATDTVHITNENATREAAIDECIAAVERLISNAKRSGRHTDLDILRQEMRAELADLKRNR